MNRTLMLMQATFDSTTDGILVTDAARRVITFNGKFLRIWGVSAEKVEAALHGALAEYVAGKFSDPARLKHRILEIYGSQEDEITDVLELADGRT